MNKSYLILGASGGIGSALSKKLNTEGNQLILVSRTQQSLDSLLQQLNNSATDTNNASIHGMVADISTLAGIKQLVDDLRSAHLSLDYVINLAGSQQFNGLEQQSDAAIETQIYVNLTAPILLSKHLLPLLKAQQQPSCLINIGSTFGSIGFPNFAPYCASKFGLRGFSEALRRELSGTNIRVSYIAPRATDTKMNSANLHAFAKQTKMQMDSPVFVADEIIKAIKHNKKNYLIGAKERFFAMINALFPALVDNELIKQHAIATTILQNNANTHDK